MFILVILSNNKNIIQSYHIIYFLLILFNQI